VLDLRKFLPRTYRISFFLWSQIDVAKLDDHVNCFDFDSLEETLYGISRDAILKRITLATWEYESDANAGMARVYYPPVTEDDMRRSPSYQ